MRAYHLFRYPAVSPEDSLGKLVTETPISLALTEFHFLLLYKDRIRAVCQLNDQIVYEEMIPVVRVKICTILFSGLRVLMDEILATGRKNH